MVKSIFISKHKKEVGELADLLDGENIQLISHSFLSFNAVDFSITAPYQIIFFGSPRAVSHFFDSGSILSNTKIACVGQGTANAVIEKGLTPNFIGEDSDINDVAIKFKDWSKGSVVLFPVSSISLKTVSNLFDANHKIEVVVYKTTINPLEIPPCSLYVFTSPSNVDGFLKSNSLPDGARIISWGRSTERFLLEIGIKSEVLSDSTLDSLISLLKK